MVLLVLARSAAHWLYDTRRTARETKMTHDFVVQKTFLIVGRSLRWHRRNANGSCYARFLPQKLPKTVLLRTAAHDFLPFLRVTHKIFFPIRAGVPQQRCATLKQINKNNLPSYSQA